MDLTPAPAPAPRQAARQEPFSSPALEQAPELASVLDKLVRSDALAVEAVVELARVLADGTDEVAQVRVEEWVAVVARQTRMDRRLLLRLCRRLDRYPQTVAAAVAGQVSFAQLRGIWLRIRDASPELDPAVDARIGAVCSQLGDDVDPDVLIEQVERVLHSVAPDDLARQERAARRERFLYLQPTLDRTGGRVAGFFDAPGLALLDEATAPRGNQRSDERSTGQLRADNLIERLAHVCEGQDVCAGCAGESVAGDDRRQLSTPDADLPTAKLFVRIDLDALLDRARVPATVLTRLVGGRLWMSADAARRLVEQRGAELRSVVVDSTGDVVGIGRASRVPPDWLRDATLALHDTCTGPCCDRPARDAHVDHAQPWWPTGPDQPYGSTDIGNVGPLCERTNLAKESGGWRVAQTPDGVRRWTHPATGLRVATVPATWSPSQPRSPGGDEPPRGSGQGRRGPPSSGDPPG